ncbi:redoxin family protein [Mycobacterium xenopi 4042]|uniref:Redoxin family protein n=1 Tax=Mycobacterium xenopi 4042 TaxID=1299334 RepID=X7YVF5_MYCXE|nr:redoxin family protein [Mycobacterium xenopi 4042]
MPSRRFGDQKGSSLTDPVRLQPGDKAPAFSLPTPTARSSSWPTTGAPCHRVLLSGGVYTRLHQRGRRLPRQSARPQRGRLDVVGISPDPPAKLAKFRDAEG